MKKNILEELPQRKYQQAAASSTEKSQSDSSSNSNVSSSEEEKVRQAVYDIRYRSRREEIPLRDAYNQYMQNSSMSEAAKRTVREKLFGKEGSYSNSPEVNKENYNIKDVTTKSLSKALFKVFVEGVDEKVDPELLKKELMEKQETSETKKYKVRVTDKKSGVTYVRYADRKKISELRSKGLDIEMTEYGKPYEGEKESEKYAVRKKGKRDNNFANNAPPYDKETYADKIAGAKGKDQMGGKNLKEYVMPSKKEVNRNKIDVLPKNKTNRVKVNPEMDSDNKKKIISSSYENSYSRFLYEITSTPSLKDMSPSERREYLKQMEHEHRKKYLKKAKAVKESKQTKEVDNRSNKTYKDLLKNKFRSMGIRNTLMVGNPDPENVMNIMTSGSNEGCD